MNTRATSSCQKEVLDAIRTLMTSPSISDYTSLSISDYNVDCSDQLSIFLLFMLQQMAHYATDFARNSSLRCIYQTYVAIETRGRITTASAGRIQDFFSGRGLHFAISADVIRQFYRRYVDEGDLPTEQACLPVGIEFNSLIIIDCFVIWSSIYWQLLITASNLDSDSFWFWWIHILHELIFGSLLIGLINN